MRGLMVALFAGAIFVPSIVCDAGISYVQQFRGDGAAVRDTVDFSLLPYQDNSSSTDIFFGLGTANVSESDPNTGTTKSADAGAQQVSEFLPNGITFTGDAQAGSSGFSAQSRTVLHSEFSLDRATPFDFTSNLSGGGGILGTYSLKSQTSTLFSNQSFTGIANGNELIFNQHLLLPAGSYVYDIELRASDTDSQFPIIQGQFSLLSSPTVPLPQGMWMGLAGFVAVVLARKKILTVAGL